MSEDRLCGCGASWRVARLLVRLAGAIHPSRRAEWYADVAFLQSAEAIESGLVEAWWFFASAPGLACRLAVRRVLGRQLVSATASVLPPPLSTDILRTRRYLGADFRRFVERLTEAAATRDEIASAVYTVGNCFAGDPQDVTFFREPDGRFWGLATMGAETLGAAVSVEGYHRLQDPLEADGREIVVLLEDELQAVRALAERASRHFPGYRGDSDVVSAIAFASGTPL